MNGNYAFVILVAGALGMVVIVIDDYRLKRKDRECDEFVRRHWRL